ncbi:MAG: hypothetical protein J6D47_14835 [Peptostreptococcaceae bacterium]|nr:hypothetical protein [Peptostreptococcaceae bacterium]
MKINDIVSRKSYKNDIWFKILDIQEDNVILQGLDFRLIADANISDLEKINIRGSDDEINSSSINLFKNWYMKQNIIYSSSNISTNDKTNINYNSNFVGEKKYKKFGKILHIDGGDFVIVRGHLNKSIAYLTTNKGALNKLIGKEEKHDDKKDDDKKDDDKKGKKHVSCEPVCPEPQCMAVDGVIRHTTVWIPFETLVSVEGAQVGDRVRIESLTVEPLYKNNRIHEIIEDCLIVGMTINDLIQVSVIVDEGIRPCNTQEYLQ